MRYRTNVTVTLVHEYQVGQVLADPEGCRWQVEGVAYTVGPKYRLLRLHEHEDDEQAITYMHMTDVERHFRAVGAPG